jgi:hypothetical protein
MDIDELKVDELKSELKKRGCSAADLRGKKTDLVNKLRELIGAEPVPATSVPTPQPDVVKKRKVRDEEEEDTKPVEHAAIVTPQPPEEVDNGAPPKRYKAEPQTPTLVEAKEQSPVAPKIESIAASNHPVVERNLEHAAVVALSARDEAAAQLDDDEYVPAKQRDPSERVKCPYLDTVNRNVLDFDMEKLCSVTLVNRNIYACLVCGKFLQG